MPATDATVTLPAISSSQTGQLLDADTLVVSGTTVLRERQRISGEHATDLAVVTSSGGLQVEVTNPTTTVTANQGTSPWLVQAATSLGALPVSVQFLPVQVVASTTGGSAPVSLGSSVVNVVSVTTGGNAPVSLGTAIVNVLAVTSGNAIPVATHAVTQSAGPWTVVASSTGGAQPVAQSSTPWVVVASTTGGNVPVSLAAQALVPIQVVASTTGGNAPVSIASSVQITVLHATSGGSQPVSIQNTLPLSVVSSTTGGAIAVSQSGAPWPVSASTTGGPSATGLVKTTQPASLADGTVGAILLDSKGRQVVILDHFRQIRTNKFVQVTSTAETVLLAGTSGTYHDLLVLIISAATSNTLAANCIIKDSSGGNTVLTLLVGTSTGALAPPVNLDFDPPVKHSTATSTGSAWTATVTAAGTFNIFAMFADWTS